MLLRGLQEILAASFDHLVGTGEKRGRDREPHFACGNHIDREFKFCGHLNRQFTDLRPTEETIHIGRSAGEQVSVIRPVSDEATLAGKIALRVDRWKLVSHRQRQNEGTRDHEETV